MTEDDAYVAFLERAALFLEDAVKLLRAGDRDAAVDRLERVVILCERHARFALRRGDNIGAFADVAEACVRDAICRRADADGRLAALLRRIATLALAGLH